MWNSQDEMPELYRVRRSQIESTGTATLFHISLHQLRGFGGPFCLQHLDRADPALGNGARRIQRVCHQRRNKKSVAGCSSALELAHVAMIRWKTCSFGII